MRDLVGLKLRMKKADEFNESGKKEERNKNLKCLKHLSLMDREAIMKKRGDQEYRR